MRDKIIDAIIILLCVSLPVLFVVLFWDLAADRGIFDYREDGQIAEQKYRANYCKSVSRAFGENVKAGKDSSDSQPNPYKNDYDSCQQWRSADATERAAFWTKAQGIVTGVGFLFVVVATAAAGFAAHYASRQAEAAETALGHAKEAADHARRQADTAETAYANLERPHLFAEVHGTFLIPELVGGLDTTGDLAFVHSLSPTPSVSVVFRNHGRLPAVPIALSLDFDVLAALPADVRRIPNVPIDMNSVIPPGEATPKRDFRLDMPLDRDDVAAINSGHAFIWFYGEIVYCAPSGKQYETAFCWRWNGLANAFRPFEDHNLMT